MNRILKISFGTALLVPLAGSILAAGRPAPTPGAQPPPGPSRSGLLPLPTTTNDFFQPGQQPEPNTPYGDPFHGFETSFLNCINCHDVEDDQNSFAVVAPYNTWATSMMAHSARDIVWQAALSITNQDANMSGEYCIRCHAPQSWGSGLSETADLSNFMDPEHFEGVGCHMCHRMVDPIQDEDNPVQDDLILQDLINAGTYPDDQGNGRFIFDPEDTRRGPEDDWSVNMHGVAILVSPHHDEGSFCASCHDLSNPVFSLQGDGSFEPNASDAAHPTQDPHEMMPEQRTYSEWLNSDFANGGVVFPDGRFGGDVAPGTAMASCQDCHMPKNFGASCVFWYVEGVGLSPDVPDHAFVGANTWVLRSVHELWEPNHTGLSEQALDRNTAQTTAFLQAASDMDLLQQENDLSVTITNWSGHKLPTGFPEGRRIWLNVVFFDETGTELLEHGWYDFDTGDATLDDTKVYEKVLGLDQDMADLTGLPAGSSHHITLVNTIIKDNCIPPAGYTQAAFEEILAAPVGTTYDDYQHWDETIYDIPKGAAEAVVTLYYQTTSKDYIEFLRDNSPVPEGGEDSPGQVAYDQWVLHGRSAPVVMDSQVIVLGEDGAPGDTNGDGIVNVEDLLTVIAQWGSCSGCEGDLNDDGFVNVADLLIILANWG